MRACVVVAAGIVVAQTVMDGRQAIRRPRLMLAHNLLLTVGSAGLFAYTLALSVAHYRDNGWEAVWNDPQVRACVCGGCAVAVSSACGGVVRVFMPLCCSGLCHEQEYHGATTCSM